MKRFGIKAVFIAITLVAITITSYPKIRRHIKWNNARGELLEWSSNLKRRPGDTEVYWYLDLNLAGLNTGINVGGSNFAALTGEPKMTVGTDKKFKWTIDSSVEPDPTRLFVIPPGKWVDTIDDVILEWDAYTRSVK